MAVSHAKLDLTINVKPLLNTLKEHADLFGRIPYRKNAPNSPHSEMTDIWIRFNDVKPFEKSGDFTKLVDEHESVWYENEAVPEAKKICSTVMEYCKGSRLGGVLITKLEPGKEISPHTDSGWHADYYDKYYIPIVNKTGSSFYFYDGVIDSPDEGSVWFFDNSFTHWVKNDSDSERIAMIICLKSNNILGGGECLTQ
ncbi:MAG: aspartyl/asparaginyl beta-hydroxylase domain-containing protein [Thiohalomonadales bacterium]